VGDAGEAKSGSATKAGAPSIPLARPSFSGHLGSTLAVPEVLRDLEIELGLGMEDGRRPYKLRRISLDRDSNERRHGSRAVQEVFPFC